MDQSTVPLKYEKDPNRFFLLELEVEDCRHRSRGTARNSRRDWRAGVEEVRDRIRGEGGLRANGPIDRASRIPMKRGTCRAPTFPIMGKSGLCNHHDWVTMSEINSPAS
jgi:hypothetical protein